MQELGSVNGSLPDSKGPQRLGTNVVASRGQEKGGGCRAQAVLLCLTQTLGIT